MLFVQRYWDVDLCSTHITGGCMCYEHSDNGCNKFVRTAHLQRVFEQLRVPLCWLCMILSVCKCDLAICSPCPLHLLYMQTFYSRPIKAPLPQGPWIVSFTILPCSDACDSDQSQTSHFLFGFWWITAVTWSNEYIINQGCMYVHLIICKLYYNCIMDLCLYCKALNSLLCNKSFDELKLWLTKGSIIELLICIRVLVMRAHMCTAFDRIIQ